MGVSEQRTEGYEMTTTQMITVMQASEAGEKIESRMRQRTNPNKWLIALAPKWDWYEREYRVKPKEVERVEVFEVMEFVTSGWVLHQLLYIENHIEHDWIKTGRSFIVPKH